MSLMHRGLVSVNMLLSCSGPSGFLRALPLVVALPGHAVALLRLAASPSCCGSCERLCLCSSCCCSLWAWHVWCPSLRRTTAAPTTTTLPAPSTPCCATPMGPRPSEVPLQPLPTHTNTLPSLPQEAGHYEVSS